MKPLWLTWDDAGNAMIAYFEGDKPVYVRPATIEDRAAMYQGKFRHDRERDPVTRAWNELARNGG